MWVASDQIQAAPDTTMNSSRKFIDGFARVGDELFIILDVDQMLDPANLDEVHRVSLQGVKDSRSSLGAD
jgi:purine-binding chemotaxis protein CheW